MGYRPTAFLLSKRLLFLAWQGRSSEAEVKSLVFSVKSNPLNPLPFYSFAPSALLFSKIFKGLKKIFHFGEKKFSTKRKFNLDIPKLQYFPIGTRVLAKKYWEIAE